MPLEYFERRERALLGERYGQLYAPQSAQPARGVTVSALRCSPERFAQTVDFAAAPSPFCPQSFIVSPDFKPGRHPYYHAGVFYSQEPSAASAAPLLGVRAGMRVLDMCAAPGGKSSQLAAALGGYGLLVSNEYVPARAEILKSNLERMGVANAVILNETPARIAEALPEFFDRVLVDAPCSGEGMFRKEPEAVAQHSEALVIQCAALGAQILDCAAAALAPGGQLVYSTCTFAPEEDEAQAGAFLARHPEFELADALGNVNYTFGRAGEENRCGGANIDTNKLRRIWPCDGGEGHFMARFVKSGTPRELPPLGQYTDAEQLWLAAAGESGKKAGKPPKGAAKQRGEAPAQATAAQSLALWHEFAAQYFPQLAAKPAVMHGGGVLLPVPMPSTGLHILRAGVFVGSVQKGRFVPEHHLFTAFGAQCANREELTLTSPQVYEYLSGREIPARTAANGWCCVTVDGFPLGGGKVSNGVVKNHYPKALRLMG